MKAILSTLFIIQLLSTCWANQQLPEEVLQRINTFALEKAQAEHAGYPEGVRISVEEIAERISTDIIGAEMSVHFHLRDKYSLLENLGCQKLRDCGRFCGVNTDCIDYCDQFYIAEESCQAVAPALRECFDDPSHRRAYRRANDLPPGDFGSFGAHLTNIEGVFSLEPFLCQDEFCQAFPANPYCGNIAPCEEERIQCEDEVKLGNYETVIDCINVKQIHSIPCMQCIEFRFICNEAGIMPTYPYSEIQGELQELLSQNRSNASPYLERVLNDFESFKCDFITLSCLMTEFRTLDDFQEVSTQIQLDSFLEINQDQMNYQKSSCFKE